MTDTLRSICERCIHLNDPQLDFIPSESARLRQIILRDLKELVSAASSDLEKAVIVFAGSILEAVLYGFIQAQQSYITAKRGSEFKFDPEQGLERYKNIFNRWFRDVLPNAVLSDSTVEYRNLVHVNQELNSAPDICALAARDMMRALDALLGDLAQFPATP
jgi:hypothetical protein